MNKLYDVTLSVIRILSYDITNRVTNMQIIKINLTILTAKMPSKLPGKCPPVCEQCIGLKNEAVKISAECQYSWC